MFIFNHVDDSVDTTYDLLKQLNLIETEIHIPYTSLQRINSKVMLGSSLENRFSGIIYEPFISINGSGTYHHHTYGFCRGIIEQLEKEYDVIVFDRHTDLGDDNRMIHCANHIGKLVQSSQLAKSAVILGSDKMLECYPGFLDGRIQIYPYSHNATFFNSTVDLIDADSENIAGGTRVSWKNIKNLGHVEIIRRTIILTEDLVYVSIDLDVLKRDYSLTGYGNGLMMLEELLDGLKEIRENKTVLGVDITGAVPGSVNQTHYTIAAIVNELTGCLYERNYFFNQIGKFKENWWHKYIFKSAAL